MNELTSSIENMPVGARPNLWLLLNELSHWVVGRPASAVGDVLESEQDSRSGTASLIVVRVTPPRWAAGVVALHNHDAGMVLRPVQYCGWFSSVAVTTIQWRMREDKHAVKYIAGGQGITCVHCLQHLRAG